MVANVSARGNTESTNDVCDRFQAVSKALEAYFQLAFQPVSFDALGQAISIKRSPVVNVVSASLSDLLTQIPDATGLNPERLDENTARANIDMALTQGFPLFSATHPNWPADVDFWYRQILRDYEVVRIPMVIGTPSLTPPETRNPANGFLDIRKEIILALCDVGNLRWGASDFGNLESGDVQHFDTAGRIACETGDSAEIRIDLQSDAGLQQALASLQFDPGPVDNQAGNMTRQAANDFMADRGKTFVDLDDDLRAELAIALQEAAIPF